MIDKRIPTAGLPAQVLMAKCQTTNPCTDKRTFLSQSTFPDCLIVQDGPTRTRVAKAPVGTRWLLVLTPTPKNSCERLSPTPPEISKAHLGLLQPTNAATRPEIGQKKQPSRAQRPVHIWLTEPAWPARDLQQPERVTLLRRDVTASLRPF